MRDTAGLEIYTTRATLRIVSAGDWFGSTRRFEGAAANHIVLGGARMPLPRGGICCDIRRSDAGFVLIGRAGAGPVRVNGQPVSGPRVLSTGDQIGAGGALVTWTVEAVPEARGNGRQMPREEGLSSVYQGLKKLFRKLGLFRTAEPIP